MNGFSGSVHISTIATIMTPIANAARGSVTRRVKTQVFGAFHTSSAARRKTTACNGVYKSAATALADIDTCRAAKRQETYPHACGRVLARKKTQVMQTMPNVMATRIGIGSRRYGLSFP